MRPGGIQDESSKHEQQKGPKMLRLMPKKISTHFRMRHTLSQCSKKVMKRRIRAGSLTTLQRQQRRHNVINSHTAWMERVLLAAEKSQLIDPAFVQNVAAAVKDDLEVAAAAPTMHNLSDYEHFALCKRRMIQLVEARRVCAYLCKVLDLERAGL